ncbi:extracellular solute-binding protein [Paenibacillus sp. GCM10027626]|uniref:extracellular solute-binding protein n=1 Tax=Paenibacillus sp. GCM10027626 TaxID=3273411 RepID=UPI00362702AF
MTFLLLALLTSLFAGCSSPSDKNTAASPEPSATNNQVKDNKPASWISDEPLEFTMLYTDNATYPFNENWPLLEEIKKRTNVSLKIIAVPDSDYKQKLQITLGSGEIPDLFIKADQAASFADSGIVLPVSDYMDKLPHFKALIEKYDLQGEIDDILHLDKKLYRFPGFQEQGLPAEGLAIRTDLLQKHHIEIPKTYEQLYDALKTLKAEYKDSIPFTNTYEADALFSFMTPSWGTSGGWNAETRFNFNRKTEKWEHAPTSKGYKALLIYLRNLMNEKLLDQEAFTQNADQFLKKLVTGKSFAAFLWYDQLKQINADGKKNVGPEFNLEMIAPLAGTGYEPYAVPVSRRTFNLGIPASAAKKPHFDQLLKFVDWLLYSEEGYTLTSWGIEGKTYNAADGKKAFTDEIVNSLAGIQKTLSQKYGVYNNNFTFFRTSEFMYASSDASWGKFAKNLVDNQMVIKTDPILQLSEDQKEQEILTVTPLKDFTNRMDMEFIFGKASIENDWEKYVKEADSKGRQKMTDFYNEIYQKQIGK